MKLRAARNRDALKIDPVLLKDVVFEPDIERQKRKGLYRRIANAELVRCRDVAARQDEEKRDRPQRCYVFDDSLIASLHCRSPFRARLAGFHLVIARPDFVTTLRYRNVLNLKKSSLCNLAR
jgi:hypothetical protein